MKNTVILIATFFSFTVWGQILHIDSKITAVERPIELDLNATTFSNINSLNFKDIVGLEESHSDTSLGLFDSPVCTKSNSPFLFERKKYKYLS